MKVLKEWLFNNSNGGFSSFYNCSTQYMPDHIQISVTGSDMYMSSSIPSPYIIGNKNQIIEIIAKNNTGNASCQIYHSCTGNGSHGISESYVYAFKINAQDSDYCRYLIPCSGIPHWNGSEGVNSIRFDLANGSGRGVIYVKSIRILEYDVYANVSGVYNLCNYNVKVDGTWKPATSKVMVDGVWR